jgi:hypothetical protein
VASRRGEDGTWVKREHDLEGKWITTWNQPQDFFLGGWYIGTEMRTNETGKRRPSFKRLNLRSRWIDPTKTEGHFGNTPIYGIQHGMPMQMMSMK